MAVFRPVELYGLTVPAGEELIPAIPDNDYPATFRITMAAIDPTAKPPVLEQVNGDRPFIGATLKIIRIRDDMSSSDSSEDDDEDFDIAGFLEDASDESDSDDEANGGPSDPEKSPKARKLAAIEQLRDEAEDDMDDDEDDDDDMEVDGVNGLARFTAKQKAKGRAIDGFDDDEDDEDIEFGPTEPEVFVLCTLDPSKNYQQPLDITINEHEAVYFQVSGSHNVYLTGNVVIPDDLDSDGLYDPDEDEEDGDFDLPPDDDELDLPEDDEESDELDDMEDPRITEVDSEDEDEIPKLSKVETPPKKGKNKRPADDSDEEDAQANIDDLLSKSLKPVETPAVVNGDAPKLSKSQQKKLRKKMKDNAGNAVATSAGKNEDLGVKHETTVPAKQSPGKSDKKVSFAETLVQGPTGSAGSKADAKETEAKTEAKTENTNKRSISVKNVQGVTVDERKMGQGKTVKKGDKVAMRYIGKLDKDKSVFDSNKTGKPFTFQVGAGQVIKGWDIGVTGMSVGGERRITVPANLAYGPKSLPRIPANSTLVFDLKLLDIK